jgi:acyl-CoA thioesterase
MNIDLEKIHAYFHDDHFSTDAGAIIDSAVPDAVECSMPITPAHRNAHGGVMGGAIFTLADFAFAVHCNFDLANGANHIGPAVGQNCSISYLKAPRGNKLIARSTCLHRGKTTAVYQISIRDDHGADIAVMIASAFILAKMPLAERRSEKIEQV